MIDYKVMPICGLPTEQQLNDLADEGWQLVQIIQNAMSRDRFEFVIYLSRLRTPPS